jgi:hypothetical protein
MPDRVKRRTSVEPGRECRHASDERRELALLAEFMLHSSVASLAGAIAVRLGGNVQDEDLIANAGLGPRRGDD